jgi:hypothetical protein
MDDLDHPHILQDRLDHRFPFCRAEGRLLGAVDQDRDDEPVAQADGAADTCPGVCLSADQTYQVDHGGATASRLSPVGTHQEAPSGALL